MGGLGSRSGVSRRSVWLSVRSRSGNRHPLAISAHLLYHTARPAPSMAHTSGAAGPDRCRRPAGVPQRRYRGERMPYIPFNRPSLAGREFEYMQEAMANGHISGDGPFTRRCNALLEEALGVPKAMLTTSCTHALEMSDLLLNMQPGDEVILPSFTFVTTANAFVLRGRSEEHTSELQSRLHLVCRLLLEKKKNNCTTTRTSSHILFDVTICAL